MQCSSAVRVQLELSEVPCSVPMSNQDCQGGKENSQNCNTMEWASRRRMGIERGSWGHNKPTIDVMAVFSSSSILSQRVAQARFGVLVLELQTNLQSRIRWVPIKLFVLPSLNSSARGVVCGCAMHARVAAQCVSFLLCRVAHSPVDQARPVHAQAYAPRPGGFAYKLSAVRRRKAVFDKVFSTADSRW